MKLRDVILLCWFSVASVLAGIPSAAHAQGESGSNLWQEVEASLLSAAGDVAGIRPGAFRAYDLNREAMAALLREAPQEFAPTRESDAIVVSLPMPDGRLARFRVHESPVMAPELAIRYPEIKTFAGQGIDDAAATVRFDTSPSGFHAQIRASHGMVCIDPQQRGNARRHLSYYRRDGLQPAGGFRCLASDDLPTMLSAAAGGSSAPSSAVSLHTFRLAVAATAEYTQFHGGTVEAGLAAIVTAINRVNAIYESEVAIRFVLVADNDRIVFTDPAADPYSNGNFTAMVSQNQSTLDELIGDENYDIGHVFGTGQGGYSWLSVVCNPWEKAKGATGLGAPVGDPFYVDYVAHEIGHQFGAHHTFNGTGGDCFDGRSAEWAYERGSGSTIMAYAGICDGDNLQTRSDPYFHSASRDEILDYRDGVWGPVCATITPAGNSRPTVDVGSVVNFRIPKGTPFTLTATGSDPDGDALTFCWEEFDLGPEQSLAAADNGLSPLFRSFPPASSPSRTFPRLEDILSGATNDGEKLPEKFRTMRFRVTARDNRAGAGGASSATNRVTVDDTAGPFKVNSPAAGTAWSGARTVEWNVAGTASSPINATAVDILLSTNGGLTFPIALATNSPNDGAETILLPEVVTTSARIKVQARGNIFFDISHGDFAITPHLEIRQTNQLSTISWPATAGSWVLDETTDLEMNPSASVWTEIARSAYQTNAARISVSRPLIGVSRFYRLRSN